MTSPTVLVPWPHLDLPAGLPVALWDEAASDDGGPDVSAVELYVAPYLGTSRRFTVMRAMPRLRAVQLLTAGYDDALAHLPAGVSLHNGRGLHDASTAEHALALILAAQRELPRWRDDQVTQRWVGEHTASLAGSRVLIVGYGSIGAAVEARLVPFEVEVTRVARTARPEQGVAGVADLDALLGRADVVVLVTPLTDETRGLLDARRLALLPDGALLVNVGRGAVVDTDALLAEAGRIRAALDVTDPEPLPPGHPLWTAPDVILTPHVAGGSATFYPRARALIADQVRRFVTGRPLANRVDL